MNKYFIIFIDNDEKQQCYVSATDPLDATIKAASEHLISYESITLIALI